MMQGRQTISGGDIARQRAWSDDTFGPGQRTEGVLKHIEEEVAEARENPDDISEWIDLIVLAIDGATRRGYTGNQVVQAYHDKMQVNFDREWPDWRDFSEDESINHVRSES